MSAPNYPANYTAKQQEFSLQELLILVRRRKWTIVQTALFVTVIGAAAAFLAPAVYSTDAKLVVDTPGGLVLSQVDATSALAPLMVMRQQKSLATQVAVLKSREFAKRVRNKLGRSLPREPVELTYATEEGTSIITVSAKSTSPQAAAAYANRAAEEYVALTRESNRQAITETREFLETASEKAARKLALIERQLMLFKARTRMEDSEEERSIRLKDAVDIETEARKSRQQLREVEAKIAGLQARLAREPETIKQKKVEENPELAALRGQIARVKAERAVALGIYTPESPQIQEMDAQVASLQEALTGTPRILVEERELPNPKREALQAQLDELGVQRDASVSLDAQLQASAGKKTGQVSQFAPWQVTQSQLQRDRQLAEDIYKDYSEKLRDLNVRERAMAAGATVMEEALIPGVPVGPGKPQQVAFAAAVGLLLGLGFGFLQEFLDDRVNSPDDLARLTSLPVLCAVPQIPEGQGPLVHALAPNSHVAEAYRALRSNIGFAALDRPLRRLQVTSPSKGEGKTVTSVNLATAMAIDGKRVILVDADLRRPSVHRVLGRPAGPGLSEVLAGLKPLEEAIQETDVPNLRVVCSGPVPPNPAELLGGEAFDRMLEELEGLADLVVVDSPPCMPVTDPLIIAGRMDGVVLVLNMGNTRRTALKHVLEQLDRARARVLGVLFNRMETGKGGYYYYYYYHYYGDGYYSEAAERGESHRANGKGRHKVLHSGATAPTALQEDDDDA